MPSLSLPKDSVFGRFIAFATDEVPFADDEPILPRKVMEDGMDQIAQSFEDTATKLIQAEAMALAKKLEGANAEAINKADWNVQGRLRDLLWGLWSDGWDMGQAHGAEEIEQLVRKPSEFKLSNDWAEFATKGKRKQVGIKIEVDSLPRRGMPDLRSLPLRKSYLAQAIDERTLLLSENVSEETKQQIKEHLRAYAGLPGYEKISKQELYARIRNTIDGDGSDSPQGVRARSRTIGKTEVTGVYGLGRLHTYQDSGRVQKVRYQTFEYPVPIPGRRPCPVCIPKNGHILDLQTQWQLIMTAYLIPAHGNCFTAGTKILMANGTSKNIEDVKINDRVVTATASGTQKVYNTMQSEYSGFLVTLSLEDGSTITATSEHPIWDGREFKAIGRFRVGEKAFRYKGVGREQQKSFDDSSHPRRQVNHGDSSGHEGSRVCRKQGSKVFANTPENYVVAGSFLDSDFAKLATTNKQALWLSSSMDGRKPSSTKRIGGDVWDSYRGFEKTSWFLREELASRVRLPWHQERCQPKLSAYKNQSVLFGKLGESDNCLHARIQGNRPNRKRDGSACVCSEGFIDSCQDRVERSVRRSQGSMAACGQFSSRECSTDCCKICCSSKYCCMQGEAVSCFISQNESKQSNAESCSSTKDAGKLDQGSSRKGFDRRRAEDLQSGSKGGYWPDTFPVVLGGEFCQSSESFTPALDVRAGRFLASERELLHPRFLSSPAEAVYRNQGKVGARGEREAAAISRSLSSPEIYADRPEEVRLPEKIFQNITPLRVTDIEWIPYNGTVYNFSVENDEVYIADGILVHNCACHWIPLLDDEGDKLLAAVPGRAPKEQVGAAIAPAWMGYIAAGGKLIMTDALKREVAKRKAEEGRKQKKRQALTGLAAGVLGLSFAGILYAFFNHWQNQRSLDRTGGMTIRADQIASSAGELVGEIVQQQLGDRLQQKAEEIQQAQQAPITRLLAPNRIANILSSGMPLDQITMQYLRSTGLNATEAQRVQGALKNYLKWLNAQPGVRIGGFDLNLASANDLVSTGKFNERQAAAIVRYTRNNPISRVEDLSNIKDDRGRKVFRQADLNKLNAYWLQHNINANHVDIQFLRQELGITDRVARSIILEREISPYLSEQDLYQRLTTNRRLAPSTVKGVLGKMRSLEMRIDPTDRRLDLPMSQLDRLPELLPAQRSISPLRQTTTQPPGAPPLPVDSATAEAQRQMQQQAQKQVTTQRLDAVRSDAIGRIDSLLTKRLGSARRSLEAKATLSEAERTARDRSTRALQSFHEAAAGQVDSANNLIDEINGIMLQRGAGKYEAMQILDQQSNTGTWLGDRLQDIDRQLERLNRLDGISTGMEEAGGQLYGLEQSLVTRKQEISDRLQRLVDQEKNFDIADEISGIGGLDAQVRIIQSELSGLPPADAADLQSQVQRMQQAFWFNRYVRQIDDQIGSIQGLQSSLIGRASQMRSMLNDRLLELASLRAQLQEERDRYRFSMAKRAIAQFHREKLL